MSNQIINHVEILKNVESMFERKCKEHHSISTKIYEQRKIVAKSKNCFLPDLLSDYIAKTASIDEIYATTMHNNEYLDLEEYFETHFNCEKFVKKMLLTHNYFDLSLQLTELNIAVSQKDTQIQFISSFLADLLSH